MLNPKTVDVTKGFVTSGVKEIGEYIYILLIDLAGQTIIKRVKSDNSEIKFRKKSGQSIEDFWATPDGSGIVYKWIHEI